MCAVFARQRLMKTIAEPETETVQGRGGVPGRRAVWSSALGRLDEDHRGTPPDPPRGRALSA